MKNELPFLLILQFLRLAYFAAPFGALGAGLGDWEPSLRVQWQVSPAMVPSGLRFRARTRY